tara:strand:+ start:1735 stop:1926 length:192 start_codon:yes stop_codon:yes gene_type:complete
MRISPKSRLFGHGSVSLICELAKIRNVLLISGAGFLIEDGIALLDRRLQVLARFRHPSAVRER